MSVLSILFIQVTAHNTTHSSDPSIGDKLRASFRLFSMIESPTIVSPKPPATN